MEGPRRVVRLNRRINPSLALMIKRRLNSTPHAIDSSARAVPTGAPGWVTPEFIEHTLRVWQPYYDAPLTAEDALAIIQSVGQLFSALSQESRS